MTGGTYLRHRTAVLKPSMAEVSYDNDEYVQRAGIQSLVEDRERNGVRSLSITSGGSTEPHGRGRLNTIALSVIMFYSTSGGPFGLEECVKAGGAFYTLLFFLITPLIWSWQESQIVSELSCAFPSASGSVAWTEAAFGRYAGWLNGLLTWMSGATGTMKAPNAACRYDRQLRKSKLLSRQRNLSGPLPGLPR